MNIPSQKSQPIKTVLLRNCLYFVYEEFVFFPSISVEPPK